MTPTLPQLSNLAIIALGSNLGDSAKIVREAIERLRSFSDVPILASSLWRTVPVDCPPGSPPFINAVVGLMPRNGETPESLLEKLQTLERQFGRKPKSILNEPRPLDLDLIAFGGEIRDLPHLTLPHPRARERAFVLQPLNQIASNLVLPGDTKTVEQLLLALKDTGAAERLPD